ncbi:hypothetical protein LPJ70_001359, partial [Coemansia sp. RSA 2708]
MARAYDLRSILFVVVAVIGAVVVLRDLRYDFDFVSDMRAAELARRTQEVTTTMTSTVLQTEKTMVTETVQAAAAQPPTERASAAFVILTRNKDLKELRETLAQLEDRFNRRYQYPYVFLNNEPFSDDFKEKIQEVVSG